MASSSGIDVPLERVAGVTAVLGRVRTVFGSITGAGRIVGLAAIISWLLGWRLGWNELMIIATAAGLCLVISIGFVLGSTSLRIDVEVSPLRVVAGGRSAGRMVISNPGSVRSLPARVELVVGSGVAEFEVGSLAVGADQEELFILPTERRGVVPVGPATTVRGDPMGLLRRAVPGTEPIPLFVHPRTVPLGHLGAGFLRDLEGQPTPDLSPADIAFHTLRDYQDGDDRRFVHWMTTARVGKLMVRQFTDTRRAHLAVVVDGSRSSYLEADSDVCEEFELAVSIAGSLGVRAISDQQDVSMMVAGHDVPSKSGVTMLDGLAAANLGRRKRSLGHDVEVFVRGSAGISLAVVVSGSTSSIADLRAAAMRFPDDVRVLIVRVDPVGDTALARSGDLTVLNVSSLDGLTQLMLAVTQR